MIFTSHRYEPPLKRRQRQVFSLLRERIWRSRVPELVFVTSLIRKLRTMSPPLSNTSLRDLMEQLADFCCWSPTYFHLEISFVRNVAFESPEARAYNLSDSKITKYRDLPSSARTGSIGLRITSRLVAVRIEKLSLKFDLQLLRGCSLSWVIFGTGV